ncbi:DoxX family protein [Domibacillus sp. PGB-M46]|uniref:DoxX family protein n=1 Tax=Domibacillus sp. PGB-M46 TaxID=2910255 RepID=UPI001F589AA2|nr:DoxX family protein [Domibacillus sp. PGB-M46]MCI2256979.1 DoxX family protein [Domibacillus sp. PGB-M46]
MERSNEIGAFILRVFLGITFFVHGLAKFQGGIENTAGFFESLGLPPFTAYAVAVIELAGGLAMVLGLGIRVIAILFAVILVVATVKVKLAAGFLGNGQMAGYELDLALIVIAVYLSLAKKSLFALDHVLFQSKEA